MENKQNGIKDTSLSGRDQIACMAMQGLITGGMGPITQAEDGVLKKMARTAYRIADIMLAERNAT